MQHARPLVALLLVGACSEPNAPEKSLRWYDLPGQYDVQEWVEFTDVPYDFTGVDPIARLPVPPTEGTLFAANDAPPNCAGWSATDDLPREIEGIVTLHPRYYTKSSGCLPDPNDDGIDSDEKYYGSYFLQDSSGGVFVLGDSKVAHFDMGDRVRMRVRSVRDAFDVPAIVGHDVLEIIRGPEPIYYQVQTERFSEGDISEVRRVTGTVIDELGTFGDFTIQTDDGVNFGIGIDSELNRRGAYWPPGTRLQVTGPVLYSFQAYSVLVMKLGQVEELPPE
ncbi:MAG: hypothetical protein ACI8PZ_002488 [Myxococcota bacterium]|jgi:hypothetical protein